MTTSPPLGPTAPRRLAPRTALTLITSSLAVVAMVAPAVAAAPPEADPDAETTTTTQPDASPTTTTTTTLPPTEPTPDTTQAPDNEPAPAPATTTTTTKPALPAAPPARNIPVSADRIEHILATIRYLESRGDYLAPPNKGNASGAYQFIGSTWANYGGYAHAYLAPPEVQDERARLDVEMFLTRWNYDVSMIPVMWYYPAASKNWALMDIVPVPSAGNVLTIREYQTRWLGIFSFLSGQPLPPVLTEADRRARAGLPPELPDTADGVTAIAYPVLGPSRVAVPECDASDPPDRGPDPSLYTSAGLCAEQAPGVVFGVQLQPVLAVAHGVVTAVHDDPGSGDPISVVVTDVTGRRYIHSGFNDDNPGTDDGSAPYHLRLSGLARVGLTVRAGQVLGFMGNSEPLPLGIRAEVPTDATVSIDPDAVAPHIKISIVEIDGTPVDAFGPLIDALFRQTCSVAIGPWAMPPNGEGNWPVTIETTDNDRTIDSEWVIGGAGRVTATGWAAMINPHDGCPYAPAEPHGPLAAGSNNVPLNWLVPIDVPTSIWVQLAAENAARSPSRPRLG